jgi:PBP1b-binding outer membrane lipoprotein LpoB
MLNPTSFLVSKIGRLAIILTSVFLFSSCADTKVSQCKRIAILTQKVTEESTKHRPSEDLQKVLEMSDIFEESAEKMRSLNIRDSNLVTYQEGFAEIYQSHADTTRKIIKALQEKDISQARLMKQQVQKIGKKEQQLGEEMNTYCQSP